MYILIAEDDQQISELITDALREAHYTPDTAFTAADASYKLKVNDYDLAIIDWVFPNEELDGVGLVKQIRASKKNIPILMLSGRSSLIDRVAGLGHGASDYLIKPFYIPELLARIHALLRDRSSLSSEDSKLTVGPLVMDTLSYSVTLDKKPLKLNNKEFQLLKYLLLKSGNVMTRGEAMEKVWGDTNAEIMSNTVDVHIRRLRQRLGKKYGKAICSIHGVGYSLTFS